MHWNTLTRQELLTESMRSGLKLNDINYMNEKTVDKYKFTSTDVLGAGSFA
jgi:hypothetical protein